MTAPASNSVGAQVVRTRMDPVQAFALVATCLLLLVGLALVWRSLLDRLRAEEQFEATLVETANRYRLLQLDEATLRQRSGAIAQSLDDLRVGIASAGQAQAELSRYTSYAAESGVTIEMELGQVLRQESQDPAFPDLVAQRWNVEIRGGARDVMAFIERIAAGRFVTWRMENLVLKPDDAVWAGDGDVLATVDVVVYSYAP